MAIDPLYGPPKVGGDTLAYCGKCKLDIAHVIVSMIGNKPAKVICKTCKSQHNYKLGAATYKKDSALGGKTAKPRATRTFVKAEEYWEEQMRKTAGKASRKYSPKEIFKQGEIVEHPTFGMGLVEEVKVGGKIVVLFRSGDKVLIHSVGATA